MRVVLLLLLLRLLLFLHQSVGRHSWPGPAQGFITQTALLLLVWMACGTAYQLMVSTSQIFHYYSRTPAMHPDARHRQPLSCSTQYVSESSPLHSAF